MNTTVIIGAGIIGLHIAHLLKEKKHEVYVLEKEPYLAEHISGRNTGVIHSGIYYEHDPFKQEMCIKGNRQTYEWLQRLNIPHKASGKWVTPDFEQDDALDEFYEFLLTLPIPKPKMVSEADLKLDEPNLLQKKAIFIPSSGVLDAATYVKIFACFLENNGVNIIKNCLVQDRQDQTLKTTRGDMPFDLCINAAGLHSDDIAHMTGLTEYTIKPCRGDYYVVNKSKLNKPVYHLPRKGALNLGLHITPTLEDQMLIGPNAYYIDNKTDYNHRSDKNDFFASISHHLKDIKEEQITPGYTGNRPKLFKNNEPYPHFTIIKDKSFIHCLGIESPGLTAAPAIAQYVEKIV